MSSSPQSRPRKRVKVQHPSANNPTLCTNSIPEDSRKRPFTGCTPLHTHIGPLGAQESGDPIGNCDNEIVCYGMLEFPVSTLEGTPPRNDSRVVRLSDSGKLSCASSDGLLASITPREADILELFRSELEEVELKLMAHKPQHTGPAPLVLQAILYGDRDTGGPLKDTLGDLCLFLQDPVDAQRDAIYWNPQRFYNEPGRRTRLPNSKVLDDSAVHTEYLESIDALEGFTSDIEWAETAEPPSLATPLQSHQKQALTFLLSREQGWQIRSGRDIWAFSPVRGQYINRVDESTQHDPPPEFRGGILADTMGFGKTLSMISLIMYDKADCPDEQEQVSLSSMSCAPKTKATLIVVPSSLLDSWERELSRHPRPGSLTWGRHDRRRKFVYITQLQQLDIVLVSYTTVLRDWKSKGKNGVLFSVLWRRVILDEAHMIKNPSAATTEAVLGLQAERRWAVTATPVQNRLLEIQSLLQFLQAYPYSEKSAFQAHISDLWTAGEANKSIERLKRLFNALMLRRSGNRVPLPKRTDLKLALQFGSWELQHYRIVQEQAIAQIDDILTSDSPRKSYMNALQKINDLRSICNHGIQASDTATGLDDAYPGTWNERSASEALKRFPSLGIVMACAECSSSLEEATDIPGEIADFYLTQCLILYCGECYQVSASKRFCLCEPPCGIVGAKPPPVESLTVRQPACLDRPCKLTALIDDLHGCPRGTKSIVFSGWNLTLDMAKEALSAAGLRCLQVDGRVKPKERSKLLEEFQSSSYAQVLLLSLSCGAVGFTLTAASRAYLMEPQWNPALEEQALARIHRIGQTQPVTTIRFVVEKTIEEYILSVQDRKKDLIAALLSPSASGGLSIQRLLELRNLL